MNKILLMLFALIILSSIAQAAPPFQVLQAQSGLAIKYPPFDVYPYNQTIVFNYHVFNTSSGGYVNQSTLKCDLHLYNFTGYHILKYPLTWGGDNEYFAIISPTNFSYLGKYGQLVQCGNASIGGYDAVPFTITPKGHDPVGDITFTVYTIMFLVILFGLTFLFLYAIGGFLSLRLDVMDVALNIGAFFVLYGFKFLANDYLGIPLINSILAMASTITIWTNVIIPFIGLLLTMILGPFLFRKYPNIFGRMPGYKSPYSGEGAMNASSS